jgi:ankyrin repeat protein
MRVREPFDVVLCGLGYIGPTFLLPMSAEVDSSPALMLMPLSFVSLSSRWPLHYACRTGNLEHVKFLVDNYRYPVNEADAHDATPLYLAALTGHTEICQFLLERGATCDNSDTDLASNVTRMESHGCQSRSVPGKSSPKFSYGVRGRRLGGLRGLFVAH